MKILLVEDDKGIARFVKKGLIENAFLVDFVSDGEEGLELALQRSYDLIILDILLPRMDGLEVSTEGRLPFLSRMRSTIASLARWATKRELV